MVVGPECVDDRSQGLKSLAPALKLSASSSQSITNIVIDFKYDCTRIHHRATHQASALNDWDDFCGKYLMEPDRKGLSFPRPP
eukprot:2983241-Amphidinium_carterae.1